MDFEFPPQANLCTYFLTQRLGEDRGDHPAILTPTSQATYAQLDRLAAQTAEALRQNGVRQEDRVLIMLRDGLEFAAAFFGALRLGAVVTMVNPDVLSDHVGHAITYTRARCILADESVVPKLISLQDHQPLPPVVVVGGDPGPFLAWGPQVNAQKGVLAPAQVHPDDPAIWLFTSGSTGVPKAVVHRAGDFIFSTEVFARRTIGYRPDDVTVSVSKLFFGYATGTNLMFPLAHGATAALFPERATPDAVLDACARHRATVLTGVPTFMAAALAQTESQPQRLDVLKTLRFMFSAGEALPEELYRRFKECTGVDVYDGIGSAEMFHIYVSNRPGDVKPGTLGRVVDGYNIRLVGEDGSDVPDGEIGTMHVSGNSVGLCYWQDRSKSYHTFRGRWCVTADRFSKDADGYYTFHGRGDDLLKVGGRWVAPLEVENVLLSHPAVQACCVVGLVDADGLEKPLALVQLKPAQSPSPKLAAELQKHAKDRLQPYKYPREVRFMDALPYNDRGKVDRKALRLQVASS